VRRIVLGSLLIFAAAFGASRSPPAHATAGVRCTMTFRLSGWSALFKAADGAGVVTCSNGQTMNVKLRARGGGLSVGKSILENGKGEFSAVESIDEVLGTYAATRARNDTEGAIPTRVMTKGEVTLALTGRGAGFAAGVDFGKLSITRS
jgi:hypothetical protein